MLHTQKPACLLIHGFTSSPREMESLGDFLKANDCEVRIPTLPGHNRRPEDLRAVSYQDWLSTVEREYQDLAKEAANGFVIGSSMGAALALHVAANFRVNGVVALAPALRLPVWKKLAIFALSPVLRWRTKPNGPDVRNQAAGARLQSYDIYPTAALKELLQIMRIVREELSKVEAPLLIMHGRHDATMSLRNVEVLRRSVSSQDIQIEILDNSAHVVTVDYDDEKVKSETLKFIRRHQAQ
jgi:carboxylesterase